MRTEATAVRSELADEHSVEGREVDAVREPAELPSQSQAMVETAKQPTSKVRGLSTRAVRRLTEAGNEVTVAAVAREVGVTLRTVHQHGSLLGQVRMLGAETVGRPGPAVVAHERVTASSLRARLNAAKVEIERPCGENPSLRAELVAAWQQIYQVLGRGL